MKVIVEDVAIPETGSLDFAVRPQTHIRVTAVRARQLVGIHLGNHVGLLLHGTTPDELVVRQDRIYWRVPVVLARGREGQLGCVGTIDVDAGTGDLIIDDTLIQEIQENARILAARHAHPAIG